MMIGISCFNFLQFYNIFYLTVRVCTLEKTHHRLLQIVLHLIIGSVYQRNQNTMLYGVLHSLECITLYQSALHCIRMHYTVLKCITLHQSALHCITLQQRSLNCIRVYITLQQSTLHCIRVYYTRRMPKSICNVLFLGLTFSRGSHCRPSLLRGCGALERVHRGSEVDFHVPKTVEQLGRNV